MGRFTYRWEAETFIHLTGWHQILDKAGGNKYKIQNLNIQEVTIKHADDLNKVRIEVERTTSQSHIENEEINAQTESDREDNRLTDDNGEIND